MKTAIQRTRAKKSGPSLHFYYQSHCCCRHDVSCQWLRSGVAAIGNTWEVGQYAWDTSVLNKTSGTFPYWAQTQRSVAANIWRVSRWAHASSGGIYEFGENSPAEWSMTIQSLSEWGLGITHNGTVIIPGSKHQKNNVMLPPHHAVDI